jgi:hypothetical protein
VDAALPSPNAIEKPRQRVLLTRIGFGAAILGELSGAAVEVYAATENNTPLFVTAWLLTAPCILFALCVVFSIAAFPFNYSWLGRLLPANPPPDWQSAIGVSSAIKIGNHFSGSISVWRIGSSGIQLLLWPLGSAFIASSQIVSIRKQSLWWHVMEHTSHEVRGPICVTRSVTDAITLYIPEVPVLGD